MSITQDPQGLTLDTSPAPKPTPKPKPAKPASTPGGIPAAPAIALGAATTTAAVGALGAATGGLGVAVLAGAGAVAAGTGAARKLRNGGMGKTTTTRTITKTSGSTGGGRGSARKLLGAAGGGRGRSGGAGGKRGGLLGRSGTGGGSRRTAGGVAARARQAADARKNRPASPTARREQQTAARRARIDRARAARTQAANAKRVAAARKGAGMKSGMKSAGKSGRTGGLLGGIGGRKSPHARMTQAHKRNQRANARAAKATQRRQQQRAAADTKRAKRVADARHRGRLRIQTCAPGKKAAQAAKRAAKRRRAALWAATGTASARLLRGGKRTGAGIRETWQDTMTHVLGGAQLLNALEQARLFNDAHGIGQIPDVPDTLVHTSTPLSTTGPRSEINPMSNPFNLLPEAEDMLSKIQRAEVGGMLSVIYAFDSLPAAIRTMSDAYIVLANRAAAEMPLNPEIGASLEQVARAFKHAENAAEQVGPAARKLHEHDIERLENQRTNEQAWDVTAQD